MIIGEVKAAANPPPAAEPFWIAIYWFTTCCCTEFSQSSIDTFSGSAKSGPLSSSGSVMSGSDLKKSTPPVKSLIARPEFGSSRIPPGTEPETSTPSGPSSDRAKRIVKPPRPEKEKPASTPMKKTRSFTGLVRSKVEST